MATETNAELPPSNHRQRRLLVLLALGVLVVSGGLTYRYYFLQKPDLGTGPAGPAVPRSAFQSVWTTQKVHVFAGGDSITAGLGANNASHRFFDRLIRCPDDEFPEMQGLCLSAVLPNLTSVNTAVSGTNSQDHLAALQANLQAQPEDTLGIVILTTGGNDLIHWYGTTPPREGAMYGATWEQAQSWIDNYQQRLNQMLDLIIARFPGGCHIFIGDIYDPTDGRGDAPTAYLPAWPDALQIHAAYNRVIHAAAAQRPEVHVVPLYDTFLGHGIHARKFWLPTYRREDPTYWYYGNIEDPNDRGHDAVRRAFLIEIARVLSEQAKTSSAPDQPAQ